MGYQDCSRLHECSVLCCVQWLCSNTAHSRKHSTVHMQTQTRTTAAAAVQYSCVPNRLRSRRSSRKVAVFDVPKLARDHLE